MSRLIGRDDDCARLEQLVATGGTVTLVGPGGVGKTRLVRELAAWRAELGEVIPFAQLAEVPSDSSGEAVARALGYESVEAAIVGLAEHPGIVVLDNCEHLVAVVRRFVESLHTSAEGLVVVATSRVPLGIDGEQLLPVAPLGLPSPGGHDAASAPAVELFFDRAHAAGATLRPDPGVLGDVGALCRALDGLPLAIELAAARARAITPADLVHVVDQRLHLLRRTTSFGDRHDSMQAAIEVSTSLLSSRELTIFRRLGVFTGSFDLGLAHAVAGDPADGRLSTLDVLATLVDRSLLTSETSDRLTRYRLLELLREHALDELGRIGERADVEERFVGAMTVVADHFVADAVEQWGPAMSTAATAQFANLVRAVELCLERDASPDRALRLVLPMFAALHQGFPTEVWAIGVRVLQRWPVETAPLRAEALAVLATAAAIAGRPDDVATTAGLVVDDPAASQIAVAVAERAWGLAARDDPSDAARHFERAASVAAAAGYTALRRDAQVLAAGQIGVADDEARALQLLDGVVEQGAAAGDLMVTSFAHLMRACVLVRIGDLGRADAAVTAAGDAMIRMGQPWWDSATIRLRAAVTALGPDGWRRAAPLWREAVDRAAGEGAVGELAIVLRTAASVAQHLGELHVAATLFAAAPRSTAITVLPELFPAEVAALRAGTQGDPSLHLVEVVARARDALDEIAQPAEVGVDTSSPGGPSLAPAELVAENDAWRVAFNGRTTRVRDMKGIGDLAVLLRQPGVEVHALQLMGARDVGGDAGPAVDQTARRAYEQRIVELQGDVDEAREANDWARADRAEAELDALVAQLSNAFGLGRRARSTGSSSERARTAVTYRIRAAIRRLEQVQPELGRHLTNSVRTGTWCSYRPEVHIVWHIDPSV